uniref:Uncharacterized protein n=1 Tax=Pyramimonas obovata TaxID=1411642 RepID=A0A7S0RQ25_9CHLO|mmetsp:Transcript_39652/g.86387  ORF Transcript_39652/g.86387 Transcript_39652/m.86387 type:complete len:242 (+) Transcript_39652:180-905(+)|eukprot:CAMPEP_0118935802 /NCGR_PEP_ID=MMETSP1169-20130426/15834_1 /TAXON_ID=36882 /ORGANISM="Pyramimonas obovata, Strain CCMP722" /LENGTH=241 /DNA_ID=CAMNT_0006878865 /DNA_START=129 /DNA_END=854 /DNA_ORIENTATION=-
MAYSSERWSRGCGTGIGISSHKNQYRLGVAIENWVEDEYSQKSKLARQDSLLKSQGVGFNDATTNILSFNAEEKYGKNILGNCERKDGRACTEQHHKFAHGLDPGSYKDISHWATLNSLTMAAPAAGATRVTQNIFLGGKTNDAQVPANLEKTDLMTRKRQQQAAEKAASMYTTTNNAFFETTAQELKTIYDSGATCKRELQLSQADGGQACTIGRKAKGDSCDTFDQTYQSLGLRKAIEL